MSTKPKKMEESLPNLSSHSNNDGDFSEKKEGIKNTSL